MKPTAYILVLTEPDYNGMCWWVQFVELSGPDKEVGDCWWPHTSYRVMGPRTSEVGLVLNGGDCVALAELLNGLRVWGREV